MQTKQEHVDSLKNDTVLITVTFLFVFQPNTTGNAHI